MKRLLQKNYPFAIGMPAIIWQISFFYLPLTLLFIGSVVRFTEDGHFAGLSLEKFLFFLKPAYFSMIFASLLLALTNTLLCLCIAYPLAHFMAFRGKPWRDLLLFFLIVPFWTNFLLHLYAWFYVLEKEGFLNVFLQWLGLIKTPIAFLNSLFAIMVMMVYYYLPFMVLPIYTALERFDVKLLEASYDLGASRWQTMRKIQLPICARAIKTGFFLVFVPSFGEFAIPELMGGDRWMFIGNAISQFILGDTTGTLGTAFTVLACVCLLISMVILYLAIDYLLTRRQVKWAK